MQIFISYAREDFQAAKRLFDSLKSVPELLPWLDKENLLPGVDWEEEILTAIHESQIVILILSEHSLNKDGFVQKEFRQAIERFSHYPPGRIYLIPARVKDCYPHHRELKKLQWVDLFPDWDFGIRRILESINKLKRQQPHKVEAKTLIREVDEPSVEISIHREFLESLAHLSEETQQLVRETLVKVAKGSNEISRQPVGKFAGIKIGTSFLVLAYENRDAFTFVHVSHNDSAWHWANTHIPVADRQGKLIGLVRWATVENLEVRVKTQKPNRRVEIYKNLGIPSPIASWLATANTREELMAALYSLAPELRESVLKLWEQGSIVESEEWGAPSDVRAIESDSDLEFALRFPEHLWRVFLHPRQRFAVDIPEEHNILLRGGPGTGKSVTLLHRFIRLARAASQRQSKPPVFIALTPLIRQYLLEGLYRLTNNVTEELIVTIRQVPKNFEEFKKFLNGYSSVLIDEGQNLDARYIEHLMRLLENTRQEFTPHFISYDANQSVAYPSGYGLERLSEFFDTASLTYSYRATDENVRASLATLDALHSRFEGKGFQNTHHLRAMRDRLSSSYISGLSGPRVESYRVTEDGERDSIISSVLDRFFKAYKSRPTLAVIVVGDTQTKLTIVNLRASLSRKPYPVEVLTPVEAQGREYHAGIVVDQIAYPESEGAPTLLVTKGAYKALTGLYVGLTRFRDRVACVYYSEHSPLCEVDRIWK